MALTYHDSTNLHCISCLKRCSVAHTSWPFLAKTNTLFLPSNVGRNSHREEKRGSGSRWLLESVLHDHSLAAYNLQGERVRAGVRV